MGSQHKAINRNKNEEVFDYVIIGSGFGGSVSAMRLTAKGYSVLVLERGKRYRDQDFPRTSWNLWKYLWLPVLGCFGIMEITPFRTVLALHGSGVGGGSLGYANVLVEPDDSMFASPKWSQLADWKSVLQPFYETAKRMLGVTRNPEQWEGDLVLKKVAEEMGRGHTFSHTDVGLFFGEPDEEVGDPYFGGKGPNRTGCNFCGGCMVGCRYNAKNTLVKNYLHFAEAWGAEVRPECLVREIQPLGNEQDDGARFEIDYVPSTRWIRRPRRKVRARNVVISAGVIGTLDLLFRCRDVKRSLPMISQQLGEDVRNNNEAFMGSVSRSWKTDFSKGIAISSIFRADEETHIEPIRYPAGSAMMVILLGSPLIESGGSAWVRIMKTIYKILRHPLDFLSAKVFPHVAKRMTILMAMQTKESKLKMRFGRHLLTLFRRGLVSEVTDEGMPEAKVDVGHQVAHAFAAETNGITMGSFAEGLFNVPTSAHLLGGCPMGKDASEGVIDAECRLHNYPGIYVIDGSIMPGNPGLNPSLTITALAEYAMSRIPPKDGSVERDPLA